ncbi:MAG: hypothetical protein IT363_15140 [Methanoregulaceae archaeon]|nr:hypothetical protein [Methanoregulaceae archaeon]
MEFLTKPNCAPSAEMHLLMLEALGAEGFDAVDLTELPMSDVRRGYDTPTLLVDGVDVFGSVPRDDLSVPPS